MFDAKDISQSPHLESVEPFQGELQSAWPICELHHNDRIAHLHFPFITTVNLAPEHFAFVAGEKNLIDAVCEFLQSAGTIVYVPAKLHCMFHFLQFAAVTEIYVRLPVHRYAIVCL